MILITIAPTIQSAALSATVSTNAEAKMAVKNGIVASIAV
jgi:hypothetical protein